MVFNLDDFLLKSQQANASDVHLHCNRQPSLRIKGDIYKISANVLSYEDIISILKKTLPAEFNKELELIKDIDYIYEINNGLLTDLFWTLW